MIVRLRTVSSRWRTERNNLGNLETCLSLSTSLAGELFARGVLLCALSDTDGFHLERQPSVAPANQNNIGLLCARHVNCRVRLEFRTLQKIGVDDFL